LLSPSLTRPPPSSTLFPYTTLFRSPFQLRSGGGTGRVQDGSTDNAHVGEVLLVDFCNVLRRRLGGRHHRQAHRQSGLLPYSGHKDRKSTRLNSSHVSISYAVFCLKK